MRAVIQRVKHASVEVENKIVGKINLGLLIFLGIEDDDNQDDIEWLAKKIYNLRIFSDENALMNLAISQVDGEFLIISQFTLFAQTKKGNRPSFIRAGKPDFSKEMIEKFITYIESIHLKKVQTGIFGADMKVNLLNDGPITIVMDTKNKE